MEMNIDSWWIHLCSLVHRHDISFNISNKQQRSEINSNAVRLNTPMLWKRLVHLGILYQTCVSNLYLIWEQSHFWANAAAPLFDILNEMPCVCDLWQIKIHWLIKFITKSIPWKHSHLIDAIEMFCSPS